MEKKITKIQKLETIVKALKDNGIVIDTFDVDEYLANEQELARKKNANRKLTKVQEENVIHRAKIVEILSDADKPLTLKDIKNANENFKDFSTPKMTSLIYGLINEGKVVKNVDKKVITFELV